MPIVQGDQKVMTATAKSLAADPKYAPKGEQTFCSKFAADYAAGAFQYTGLGGMTANDMITFMGKGAEGWMLLYASDWNPAQFQERLSSAQAFADSTAMLVVLGVQVAGPHGHVAVVIPGPLSASASWKKAGLPAMVPTIAQAGNTVFSGKNLAAGMTPAQVQSGRFVIFVRGSNGFTAALRDMSRLKKTRLGATASR